MIPKRIKESKTYQRVHAFAKKYEKWTIPLMLLGGLSGDVLQYTKLDIREKFMILSVYVVVSTGTLLIMNYPAASEHKVWRKLLIISPFAHQFAIGGLLATSLLFYWFSGAFSVTWPIILIVVLFMFFNEFLREHFLRPTVQVGVLSFSMFSLLAILFSFIFNSLEPQIFVLAGVASLVFMICFTLLLTRVGAMKNKRFTMIATSSIVFLLMNGAYYLNIIPPIPLSVREATMAYNVARSDGDYLLVKQPESWLEALIPGVTMTIKIGDPIYAFTNVAAPTSLSTTLVHRWEYYDPSSKNWVTKSILSYGMTGGRDEGYRGYSYKTSLLAGRWRVTVETTRGQVLTRIPFYVVYK